MSRHMSVALTEDAVRTRRKTVTRRLGWLFLKPGDRLTLVRKSMGRRRPDGTVEPLVVVAHVEVVSVRRERLDAITDDDVTREGFVFAPEASKINGARAAWFVGFFTTEMRCAPDTEVTRIEWRYLEDESWG